MKNNSELIRLAYAMVAEPHTQHLLSDAIDKNLSRLYDADSSHEFSNSDALNEVAIHFEHAQALLAKQGRRYDMGEASKKLIAADSSPVVLIDSKGKIKLANEAGEVAHNWRPNQHINHTMFEAGDHQKFIEALKKLDDYEINKSICVVKIKHIEHHEFQSYVVTKSQDVHGENLARLSSVTLNWLPDIGFHFQEEFGLTPIELQIIKAIVTSKTLRELAKERGRSVGTLRNQLKGLLSKLSLSSQTELVCLYSGYVRLTRNRGHDQYSHSFRSTSWRRQRLFINELDQKIDYSEVGPSTGRPVIFFHDFIMGTSISEETRHELLRRNIRLIMPLLPGCGNTDLVSAEGSQLSEFSGRCIELLDSLKIDKFQIIGRSAGMCEAMHLAKFAPERTQGVIGLSPSIPLVEKKYFQMMSKTQRSIDYIAKHIPWATRLVIRTMLAKCDSGYDEEFIQSHFSESTPDLQTMNNPQMKQLARQGYTSIYTSGVEGAVRALNATGTDWEFLFKGYSGPIACVTGDLNREFNTQILKDFSSRYSNVEVHGLKDAGYFVLEQKTGDCFRLIDDQIAKSTEHQTAR